MFCLGQKIKEQRTNNDIQIITQKTIEEGQRKQWSKDKGTKDKQRYTCPSSIVFCVMICRSLFVLCSFINNGQKIKEQRTNNVLQNITQKTIEEEQRKQWSKDKGTKDKQRSTNHYTENYRGRTEKIMVKR
jgi:hypothetical protein